MFVRWNKRKRFDKWKKPQADAISAVLVESQRVDGNPRQKTIKYLGSIRSDRVNVVGWARGFWKSAEKNLSTLDLSPEVRDKIITDLNKVVLRPSDEDVAKANEEAAEMLSKIEKAIPKRPDIREWHLRQLRGLTPEQAREAWQLAQQLAPGGKMTGRHIRTVVGYLKDCWKDENKSGHS